MGRAGGEELFIRGNPLKALLRGEPLRVIEPL